MSEGRGASHYPSRIKDLASFAVVLPVNQILDLSAFQPLIQNPFHGVLLVFNHFLALVGCWGLLALLWCSRRDTSRRLHHCIWCIGTSKAADPKRTWRKMKRRNMGASGTRNTSRKSFSYSNLRVGKDCWLITFGLPYQGELVVKHDDNGSEFTIEFTMRLAA